MQWPHLVRRFFGSVVPRQPTQAEEAWLLSLLRPTEAALYRAQSPQDRSHSVTCALRVRDDLGAAATNSIVVASALHDVGKTQAHLGTYSRVLATVVGMVLPRGKVEDLSARGGYLGRVGTYLRHDEIGADLLMEAGCHRTIVAWAFEHHHRPESWTIDPKIAEALARADG
jgi:hypothetical protein